MSDEKTNQPSPSDEMLLTLIKQNDANGIKVWMDNNAVVDDNSSDTAIGNNYSRIMQFAICNNNIDLLEYLQSKNIDINQPIILPQPISDGRMRFDPKYKAPPVFYATLCIKPDVIEHLISCGADIHESVENLGFREHNGTRFNNRGNLNILHTFSTSSLYPCNLDEGYKNILKVAKILIANNLDFNHQYAASTKTLDALLEQCYMNEEPSADNFKQALRLITLKGGLNLQEVINRNCQDQLSTKTRNGAKKLLDAIETDRTSMLTISLPFCSIRDRNIQSSSPLINSLVQNPIFEPRVLGIISELVVGEDKTKSSAPNNR